MKKAIKIIGIIFAVILVILLFVYIFILNYPKLKKEPKIGKWYRVSDSVMKDSEGGSYHALFKKAAKTRS